MADRIVRSANTGECAGDVGRVLTRDAVVMVTITLSERSVTSPANAPLSKYVPPTELAENG